jgi:Mn-dependent DtxR family transcriptional regulator
MKPNFLKITEEDVLRILGESEEKLSVLSMKERLRISSSILLEAVKALEKVELILVENDLIGLTNKGLKRAKDIIGVHINIENYIKETKSERDAHRIAHLLEHYVSNEVINNIKNRLASRREGLPLTEFELGKKGLIIDIIFSDYKLFERMVSMGILLGEVLEITHKITNNVIIKINNKKIVLDESIARGIQVIEYAET